MSRLANVHVRAYRGLQDVEMKGLQDINVLIGPTNTGKSSMLEAICLATGPNRLELGLAKSLRGRGRDGIASIQALFPRLKTSLPIEIHIEFIEESGASENLVLKFAPCGIILDSYADLLKGEGLRESDFKVLEGNWRSERKFAELQIAVRLEDLRVFGPYVLSGDVFSPMESLAWLLPHDLLSPRSFDTSYSEAYVSDYLPELIEVLGTLHPHLEDIRPVKLEDDGRWRTYVRLAGKALPMHAMGDGFKAAFILLEVARRHDLLLLDTPEAYQHHKGLVAVAEGLVAAASQLGSQIILATQSLELLDLLLEKSAEREVGTQIYRFGLADGQATIYPPLSLADAREARALVGADLRG